MFGGRMNQQIRPGGPTASLRQGLVIVRPHPSDRVVPRRNVPGPSYFSWAVSQRGYIQHDTELAFDLLFHPASTGADQQAVFDALWLWLIVGGLGARVRRGYGSVQVTENSDLGLDAVPQRWAVARATDPATWVEVAEAELRRLMAEHPMARAPRVRFDIKSRAETWETALSRVSEAMKKYRKPLLGVTKDPAHGTSIAPGTTRFGLPVPHEKEVYKPSESFDRSASSVWVRVVKVGRWYHPYLVWWPTPLLPPGSFVKSNEQNRLALPGDEILTRFFESFPDWKEWNLG